LIVLVFLKGFILVEVNHSIGAADLASTAADAQLGVMHGEAILGLMHCRGRAIRDARGVFAVVAQSWNVPVFGVGETARRFDDVIRPGEAIWHVVFALASDVTCRAAYTLVEVNHHSVTFISHQISPY